MDNNSIHIESLTSIQGEIEGMTNIYLLTLKECILDYENRRKAKIENRIERLKFKATRFLSSEILGYKDDTTVHKFINKSTSRVKLGADQLADICIEMEDIRPVEDYLFEIKESIKRKQERRMSMFQEELKFMKSGK